MLPNLLGRSFTKHFSTIVVQRHCERFPGCSSGFSLPSICSKGSEGGMKEGGVQEIGPYIAEYILRIL